jgi:hypothetical protein
MSSPTIQDILRATHKDVRPLLREIAELGGSIRITNGNHIMARLGGHMTVVSLTPKDPRNDLHHLRQLIRRFASESDVVVDSSVVRHKKKKSKK